MQSFSTLNDMLFIDKVHQVRTSQLYGSMFDDILQRKLLTTSTNHCAGSCT